MNDETPRICDYEGSDYRTRFWEGQGRDYEDLVERNVIRRLLPPSGRRLLEIGAGFGRLSEEYASFQRVVLLDYSFSQLQYARERLGDERYLYVAADAYRLPFLPGVFDAATMIRVIHHFENVPAVLAAIQSVMAPNGMFILEHANKRNLKALLRYTLGRQEWNPNDLDPVEFVELNYNFHPDYILSELRAAGFQPEERIPVSFLRLGALKRLMSAGILTRTDQVLQQSGWMISPSIFVRNTVRGSSAEALDIADEAIFASPLTGELLVREEDTMVATSGDRWAIRDGIYDFKARLD